MERKSKSGKADLEYSWVHFEEIQARSDGNQSVLENKIRLAILHLESQCSARFGFMTQVSTYLNLADSWLSIPNIFDSCMIVNLLAHAGVSLSTSVTETIKSILLQNQKSDCLWNYFHKEYTLIPCDVDTSANAILALFNLGETSEIVTEMATNLLEKCIVHENGLVDVYLPPPKNLPADHPLGRWSTALRVDIVTITSLLYLLNKFGINHLPRLSTFYRLLSDILEDLIQNDNLSPANSKYAKNYENQDVICFFISRLIEVSRYGSSLFKDRLATITSSRLLSADAGDPISISCRIMTAINAEVYENKRASRMLRAEVENLIGIQSKQDFSFQKVGLYNGHRIYHFGSSALSTAFAVSALSRATCVLGIYMDSYEEIGMNFRSCE